MLPLTLTSKPAVFCLRALASMSSRIQSMRSSRLRTAKWCVLPVVLMPSWCGVADEDELAEVKLADVREVVDDTADEPVVDESCEF